MDVKVQVSSTQVHKDAMTDATGNYLCDHPLNPLDFLSAQQQLLYYNPIVMPPVSLISQAKLTKDYWKLLGKTGNSFFKIFQRYPNKFIYRLVNLTERNT